MAVTAKQIAKELGISEAAVSLALHQKYGVSQETRRRVIETARALGFDMTKLTPVSDKTKDGTICIAYYNKHGIFENSFFLPLLNGIQEAFRETSYQLIITTLEAADDMEIQLSKLISNGCKGIILFATEITPEEYIPFSKISIPLVLLDTFIYADNADCVVINNLDGAFYATTYLIHRRHSQPGYLHSASSIKNFAERSDGYFKAIMENGYSVNQCIIHRLSTSSIEASCTDMKAILSGKAQLADCYFADNDFLAIGAIRAFQEYGYKVPEDIAVVGFDNVNISAYTNPPVTTINVPKEYMGRLAAERMITVLSSSEFHPVKIEVNTKMIKRESA